VAVTERGQGRNEIVIVRHGETEWSAAGRHTSRTDLPLTDRGRERARALGPTLAAWRFVLVLCSPLRRARETCDLAGYGEVAELCDDLHEWDYGEYEGLTTSQIRERDPGWSLWREGCPGGETPPQVGARAERLLERLRGADGNALAFAHGHILRVVAVHWLVMDTSFGSRLALSAGGVGVLGWERHTEVLSRWNV
jgi:broad specificity phosphatase PhoE